MALPTLLDIARMSDASGKIVKVAEVLHKKNQMLEDLHAQECNSGHGHIVTIRTGLPAPAWRRLNYGVPQTKGQTRQVTDTCGMMATYSSVDKKLIELNGNANEYRARRDIAHIEGFAQTLAQTIIYGDTDTNPERFLGLAPRFSVPSADTDESGSNMIDGNGGANIDLGSIWLVVSGPEMLSLIYPKGSKAGLQIQDLGQQTATDADGNEFEVMKTYFEQDVGQTLEDWRFVVRICNIRRSTLTMTGGTGANLIDLMTRATIRIPDLGAGNPAFWMDRQMYSFLTRQVSNKANVNLSIETAGGKRFMAFDGIPIRRVDALRVDETQITGTFCAD